MELWTHAEGLATAHVLRAAAFEWRLAWQRRRLRLALGMCALPLGVALLGVVLQRSGIVVVRGSDVLSQILGTIFLQLLVVVLPLVWGTGLVAQEAEARTLVFLLVRPLSRGSLLAGKFLGAWAAGSVQLVAALVATGAVLLGAEGFAGATAWGAWLPALGSTLVLGSLAYGALFTLVGLLFSRPALVGLFLAFGWESAIPFLPGWIRSLTVRHHLAAFVPADALPPGMLAALSPPSSLSALVHLGAGVVLCLAASVWVFARRDYP